MNTRLIIYQILPNLNKYARKYTRFFTKIANFAPHFSQFNFKKK